MLAALILMLAIWGGCRLREARSRARAVAAVMDELDQLHANWTEHAHDDRLLSELSAFLRRLGLALTGSKLAGVTGRTFLARLEDLVDAGGALTSGPAAALADAQYRKPGAYDVDAIFRAVRRYVELAAPQVQSRAR